MSTGSRTQASFTQGKRVSTADQDAPRSALVYLFQEVSRLASPIHDRGAQMEKMKRESHGSKDATLVNLHPQCSSPWEVLSLINLQCERLLNPGDVKESGGRASTQTEQGGFVPVEELQIPAAFSPGTDVSGAYTPRSELVEDAVPGHTEEDKLSESRKISSTQEFKNIFSSTGNTFNVQVIGNSSSTLSFSTKEEILPKPSLTLDHNANIAFTPDPQSDKQPPPLSVVLSAAPSLIPGNDHSLSQQDDKLTASTSEVQPETSLSDSAAPDLTSRSGRREEAASLSAQTRRTKTPRKQRYPSKSVDVEDPDFQGVMFRMDAELDDSREQCRLLITWKYSKNILRSVRKPRLRTRAALKSLKTMSSEKESDPGTSSSKGKVCASCCTRKTPIWRDAEDGTPLCNACGIRFKRHRARCVNCWHIPRKESNSTSCCLKCGNSQKLTSAHRKHSA